QGCRKAAVAFRGRGVRLGYPVADWNAKIDIRTQLARLLYELEVAFVLLRRRFGYAGAVQIEPIASGAVCILLPVVLGGAVTTPASYRYTKILHRVDRAPVGTQKVWRDLVAGAPEAHSSRFGLGCIERKLERGG